MYSNNTTTTKDRQREDRPSRGTFSKTKKVAEAPTAAGVSTGSCFVGRDGRVLSGSKGSDFGPPGLDTIVATVKDFKVLDDADVDVVPGRYNSRTGNILGEHHLYETSKGDPVFASKVIRNNGLYQMTVSASFDGSPILRLQTSLSKVAGNGVNLMTPTPQQVRDALDRIQADLDAAGVLLSLREARLSRVDLNKTTQLPRPLGHYRPALRLLKGRYMRDRREYGDEGGFLWASDRRQLLLYDKASEMEERGLEVPAPFQGENILRFESRYLRPDAVAKLPVATVRDLYDGDRVVACEEAYRKDLRARIFRLDDIRADEGHADLSLAAGIQQAKEKGGRNWVGDWTKLIGLRELARLPGSVVRDVLINSGASRASVYRLMKDLTLVAMSAPVESIGGPLRDLYDELQDAFAA